MWQFPHPLNLFGHTELTAIILFTVVIAKQQLLSGQLPNTQSNLY